MDSSTTFSDIPPPAIGLKSNNRDDSDWDSDSSDGVVVQSAMTGSTAAASAALKAPRPVGIFESESGDSHGVGVFQLAKKQEACKRWEDEDEDGEESDQHEKDKKNSTNAVTSSDGRGLSSGAKEMTSGFKKDDRRSTNRPSVNTSIVNEKSKSVAEGRKSIPVTDDYSIRHGSRNVDELSVNDLTLSEAAKHRMPNLSRADDARPSVQEEKPETSLDSLEDCVSSARTSGFRSRKDRREEATMKEDLKLANSNLLQQLAKQSNDTQLFPRQHLRRNPSGTGSSEDQSPTRRKVGSRENSVDKGKPKFSVSNDTSDDVEDTRSAVVGFVGGSCHDDIHLLHGRRISRRDTVATDFTNLEQRRTDCGSSDDERPPTDGLVFKFFQVRRKHLTSELPAVVVEGTLSRLRERWRPLVAHCWREFFAGLSLLFSVPLLFVVELFLFVFRDIFYEVVCQMALIFGAYFVNPLITVVLFNTIVQPLTALLWNLLHYFRRATQPVVCLLQDVGLVLATVLKSFRLVEVFNQTSTDMQSRRERIRSTTGVIKIV